MHTTSPFIYITSDRRTKLSKGLIDDPAKLVWRKKEELEGTWGVKLVLGTVSQPPILAIYKLITPCDDRQ